MVFANAVFWGLGCVFALVYYAVDGSRITLNAAASVPLWMYSAGVIGAAISLSVIYLIPKAGIVNFTIMILAGQLICSSVLGATGFFTGEPHPVGVLKFIGLILVFVGSYLVIRY
jgi:transporter family-2 protein